MSALLAWLRAVPAWLVLVVIAVSVIWWQHGQVQELRKDELDRAVLTAQCVQARDNLAVLAQEQGSALSDLNLAAQARQARAEQAVADAKARAQVDYAAANRLQQERTGGDQCAAATSIIDKELGL